MNMEESERLLLIEDRIEDLLRQANMYPATKALGNYVAQDLAWLIERVHHHEREKNNYREELQLLLDGTHAEP